jgi:hypothetical protein
MRLAIVRQRYTPFGGAERLAERALDARAVRRAALVTWRGRATAIGGDADHRSPIVHDARCRRAAVCAEDQSMPATLV